MPRTPVRRGGQESVSLQAVVPWCSSCNRLMEEMVRCAREVNYFRYYKRLGPIAKLATSYQKDALRKAIRRVVNATLAVRAPEIWGEGTTACAADSKVFGAW